MIKPGGVTQTASWLFIDSQFTLEIAKMPGGMGP